MNRARPHPLAHWVLGTKETVGSMRCDEMETYFRNRYSSDNTTLAIAGAVDFDETVSLVEDICGDWKPTQPKRVYPDLDLTRSRTTVNIPSLSQAYLLMISEAPSATSDDRYAAGMVTHTLGGAEGSRLYWSLIETGIAEEAQSSYDGKDHAGEFATWAVCAPDSLGVVEEVIHTEIDKIATNVTIEDVDRARARIATAAAIAAEKPLGRMNRMASSWLRRGEYMSIEEEMKKIDAITVEHVRACAENHPLRPEVVSFAVSGDDD